jgi:hypothetical protein
MTLNDLFTVGLHWSRICRLWNLLDFLEIADTLHYENSLLKIDGIFAGHWKSTRSECNCNIIISFSA